MTTGRMQKNLWTMTLASGISRFGDHFQILATTYLTYAISRSPMAMALTSAVTSLPWVIFARWGGRLADRANPRLVFGAANLLRALVILAYIPTRSVPLLIALNFVGASISAFASPARARLLPDLVGRENLLKANARQSTVMGVVELSGPVAAGYLLGRLGPGWSFGFNSISFLFPALAMLLVVPLYKPSADDRSASQASQSQNPTWTFLRARPDLAVLLCANAAFQLGMWAINTLFYPYVADVLNRGPEVLGWSMSTYFGASLISGALMEKWGGRLNSNAVLVGGFGLATLVWFGYTFAGSVPLMLVLSVFDGTMFTLASILFSTRIQGEAPPEAVGRIWATATAIQEASTTTGMLMGGWLATAWGILPGMRASAGLSLALLLPMPLLARQMRTRSQETRVARAGHM